MEMMRFGQMCRSAGFALALGVGLQGCATTMRRGPSASDSLVAGERLGGVVDDYWRYLRVSRPDLVARTNDIVSALPDPTQDRSKKDAQLARAALASLDNVQVDALTEDAYVTWSTLRWEMEALSGWAAFHWTNIFDLSPGISVLDRSRTILSSQSIPDPGAAQRFTGLVTMMPGMLSALRKEYEERSRRGIRMSRPQAQRAITHVREMITPPDFSPFGLPRDFQVSADTWWHAPLARTVGDIITQRLNPQLDSLATFLERERELASDTLGLSRLPGGAAHYATLLRYHSTLDITPEDAHAIGLREVARLASFAAAARRDAGLPVSRDSLRAMLKRDSAFVFDERISIPEKAAQLYESSVKEMEPHFRQAPNMGLSIGVMVDPFDLSPLTSYEPATFARPSATYRINVDQLVARSALLLPGLVMGDLMPGYHLQQGAQLESPTLPMFRRLGSHDGFVGGWTIYAMGVADSLSTKLAPWQRFGLRLRELAAACGLVVDTGINALGWTHADALTFLRAYLPDDDTWLEREFILTAVESPGTLTGAALGARELRGLRRWAMRELGARFTLAAFHQEVLRVGSVPLPVLGAHLERWIWEQNHPAPPDTGSRR